MGKTRTETIELDLDGSISAAISKLEKLKKQHPKARISLENKYEYGESYARLYLKYERPANEIELAYDETNAKLRDLSQLRQAARAFAAEKMPFPRQAELDALTAELGAFAKADSVASLRILEGKLVMADMLRGAFDRDGNWVYRTLTGLEAFEDVDKFLRSNA